MSSPVCAQSALSLRHIGNGVIAGEKLSFAQPLVEHTIESCCFAGVALDCVDDLFLRITSEMMGLPEHWAEVTHLEHEPLNDLVALAQINRHKSPCAGLEKRDRFAVR